MEKMIMISEERYLKMLESYDKAVEELYQLRKSLDELRGGREAFVED